MSKQFTIAQILQTAALELSQTSINNSETQDRIWQQEFWSWTHIRWRLWGILVQLQYIQQLSREHIQVITLQLHPFRFE